MVDESGMTAFVFVGNSDVANKPSWLVYAFTCRESEELTPVRTGAPLFAFHSAHWLLFCTT